MAERHRELLRLRLGGGLGRMGGEGQGGAWPGQRWFPRFGGLPRNFADELRRPHLARNMLSRPAMHTTAFSLKRGHLTTLRYSRRILRRYDPLTPARYDLMTAVARSPGTRILQGQLILDLGLHPSTVSKMLTRMDELGLTHRSVDQEDARRRVVALTPKGELLLQAATMLSARDIDIVIESGVDPNDPSGRQVRRLNRTLRGYAWNLRDTAVALYEGSPPWVLAA